MISGIISLVLLLAFIAGTAWAYSSKRKNDFQDAANIPLDNNDEGQP